MGRGMSQRAMVWTYVIIEALVLVPLTIYIACNK
jgi:hypothetical protein